MGLSYTVQSLQSLRETPQMLVIVIKIATVLTLLGIVASLGSGLVFLVKDRGAAESRRTVKALTLRIALSMLLFVLLVILMLTGVITPNPPPM